MTPYTVADSPGAVARIESDLGRIARAVREADPGLRSLVLTGGFARGEGAVLDGKPQNDYDLVAVRGGRPPRVPYDRLRKRLGRDVGLHVDLAPVAAWRLPWVQPSIFWYETALRGRVLWGGPVLHRIRVRWPGQIGRGEPLRLLVNRAAGLLLATGGAGPHERRLQAAKALLAAFDARLLASGSFAPSQSERWELLLRMRTDGRAPAGLAGDLAWTEWAYRFKVDPAGARTVAADAAWRAARAALLEAVPAALRHAGAATLAAYARQDGVVDHLLYLRRRDPLAGTRRFALNPTGQVRLATLRLLEASPDVSVAPERALPILRPLAPRGGEPLRLLESLRTATRQ